MKPKKGDKYIVTYVMFHTYAYGNSISDNQNAIFHKICRDSELTYVRKHGLTYHLFKYKDIEFILSDEEFERWLIKLTIDTAKIWREALEG